MEKRVPQTCYLYFETEKYVGRKYRASVHVVQVLVLLAVEDVVVDDLETSKARARRGPPMNARSLQRIRGAVPTWPHKGKKKEAICIDVPFPGQQLRGAVSC